MKDIIFIQPPASFDNSKVVLSQDSVGIGMLSILAYLEQYDFTGEVIHFPRAIKQNYNFNDIFNRIKEANPKLIAIGLNWLHFSRGTLQVAAILRKLMPDTPIIVGGHHATIFAKEILEYCDDIDGIAIGESEKTIHYILKEMKLGFRHIPENTPGMAIKHPSKGIVRNSIEVVEDIDSLPFYSYKYVWSHVKEHQAALNTVRGECKKKCTYCIAAKASSLKGRKCFASHSSDYLVEQVRIFTDEGIDNITIQDPFFLLEDNHIIEFVEKIKSKNIKIERFNIFLEPYSISYKALESISTVANNVSLDFGMETGSTNVSHLLGRYYDKNEILNYLRKCTDLGIETFTWWMTGLPKDNRNTLIDTIDYIESTIKCGSVPRWVTPLILFPHTDISEDCQKYGVYPIINSFEGFLSYSDAKINKYGVYPELITHESDTQNKREIIESTIALKKAIANRLVRYRDVLIQYGWDESQLKTYEKEVRGSFY